MQTPKVFLLLSCILHQYRTSAKAFSVQDPLKGKVQRINSAEGCKSSKTLLFCQILKGSYIWQIVFQCVLDKDPCILPYHCDLQEFCVLTYDILAGQVSISPCMMLQIAPPSLSISRLGWSLISIFPQKHSLQMQPSRENLEGAFDQIVFTRLCWSIGNVLLPASLEEGQQKAIKLGQSSGCCGW